MVQALAGRWLTRSEGQTDGLAMISSDGTVTLVGDSSGESLRLVEKSPSDSNKAQFLLVDESGEELCTVTLDEQSDIGVKSLRFECADGSEEIWTCTTTEDNKPKIVPRRNNAEGPRSLARRFTKENQVGSPKHPGSGKEVVWGDINPEVESLKLKFMEIEGDGDGMFDVHELATFLQRGKIDMPNSEVKLIFDALDESKSGRVSFNDFVEFIFKRPATA